MPESNLINNERSIQYGSNEAYLSNQYETKLNTREQFEYYMQLEMNLNGFRESLVPDFYSYPNSRRQTSEQKAQGTFESYAGQVTADIMMINANLPWMKDILPVLVNINAQKMLENKKTSDFRLEYFNLVREFFTDGHFSFLSEQLTPTCSAIVAFFASISLPKRFEPSDELNFVINLIELVYVSDNIQDKEEILVKFVKSIADKSDDNYITIIKNNDI